MKQKGLLVALGVTTLLVGSAVYVFQSEKNEEVRKSEGSKLFSFDRKDVTEFTLKGKETVHIKNEGDKWQILSPVKEEAQANSVIDFLVAALGEKSVDVVAEGSSIDWKIYGLDKPDQLLGELKMLKKSGDEVTVQISKTNNYAGEPYVRIINDNRAFVGSVVWKTRLEKTSFDFRDKRIMRESMADIEEFQMKKSNATVTLIRKEGAWKLSEKAAWKVDQSQAQEVLSMLNQSDLQGIDKEGEALKAVKPKDYGLNNPMFTVNVKLKNQRVWTSKWGVNAKKEYFVQIEDPPMIAKVQNTDAEKFLKLSLNGLRDRKEAFSFAKAEVKKADIILPTGQNQLELKGDQWQLVGSSPEMEVDQDKMKSMITKAQNLQIGQFSDELGKVSAKPSKEILFKKENGELVFKVSLGDEIKRKIDGIEKTLVLAQTSLSNDWVAVDQAQINNLSLSDIVKKKQAAIAPPATKAGGAAELPKSEKK